MVPLLIKPATLSVEKPVAPVAANRMREPLGAVIAPLIVLLPSATISAALTSGRLHDEARMESVVPLETVTLPAPVTEELTTERARPPLAHAARKSAVVLVSANVPLPVMPFTVSVTLPPLTVRARAVAMLMAPLFTKLGAVPDCTTVRFALTAMLPVLSWPALTPFHVSG